MMNRPVPPRAVRISGWLGLALLGSIALLLSDSGGSVLLAARTDWTPDAPIVLAQQPVASDSGGRALPLGCGDGGRIMVVPPDGSPRVLTPGFHGACDPELSFDGKRVLFSGKKGATESWSIYEIGLDGSGLRQITTEEFDCRQPIYLGRFFTIDSPEPWRQLLFVGSTPDEGNEHGSTVSTSLYTARLDGSALRRVSFNPSAEGDPVTLPDGRVLFTGWQRSTLERGLLGRISLFAAQTDGLDYALFSGDEGPQVKRMPCVTADRRVIFVESDAEAPDGAGSLGSITLRRNLHSYRPVAAGKGGFHSPSPLPDGTLLVSRRQGETDDHGIYRLDPDDGALEPVFDDPQYHDLQARLVRPRPLPDGRSSVADETVPTGIFYGLDVYESDLGEGGFVARGEAKRLRILEGLPRNPAPTGGPNEVPPLTPRRFLGEIPVEEDGSFNLTVPANLPVELQLLDADGMALRSCSWIWVRNRETRGCIGCHEDGERTPPNRFAKALSRESTPLILPPAKRRVVDFSRDVMPILQAKCASASCHAGADDPPALLGQSQSSDETARVYDDLVRSETYVRPGVARTSPLIWHVMGRNSSRPWDDPAPAGSWSPMPPPGSEPLTADEQRTLVEWIDLGAQFRGLPERRSEP